MASPISTSTRSASSRRTLYLHVASLGDPFVVGRIASIVSTLGVAGLVFVSARSAGRVVAAALALGWLALAPVAIWGPAVKPDLVALFITVLAVVILDRRRDLAALAGFALIFAGLAKPTALLPAAALGAWLLWSDRSSFARFAFGAALAVIGAAAMISLDSVPDVWRHVVVWNELSWSAEQAGLLVVVGMLVLGVPAGLAALMGGFRGARAAYAAGALAVVVLGGREGATINYLLDATAAVALGLGALGPRLRVGSVLPALAVAQLAVGTLTLNPLSLVPGRPPTTGAWADPSRTDLRIAFRVDGRFLVEDSGLLVRAGITPVVDDLFPKANNYPGCSQADRAKVYAQIQQELVRFAAADGKLAPGRELAGRGVYTCRRLACFERAASRNAFSRVLRRTVVVEPGLESLYTGS